MEELQKMLVAQLKDAHSAERVLETMGTRPGRVVCEAMRGLVEEVTHEMEEYQKGPVLDLVIVASQQRIEHYEIAAYGTMAELARAMGQTEAADLLAEILAEEKAQDLALTELTRSAVLPAVLAAAEEGGGEAEASGGSGRRGTRGSK